MNLTAAALLSRQSMRLCARSKWVTQSIECIKWLKREDIALCSSVGMSTWELLTSLGSIYRLRLNLYVPRSRGEDLRDQLEKIHVDFDLCPNLTTFVPVPSDGCADKGALWQLRDSWIVGRADMLVPISIRPDGRLEHLLEQADRTDKIIDRRFQVEYESESANVSYTIAPEELNPHLSEIEGKFLIHWTRAFDGPWPTERPIDYYRSVIESDVYPRSAFDTLRNIAATRTLKASSKHMPGKIAAVAFSKTAPCKMLELIRWRSRYRHMSFEPYGIGIETQTAENLGIMPVEYTDPDESRPTNGDSWLCQSKGEKADWTSENEYRHRGDLDLSRIDRDKLILICRTVDEASAISAESGICAVSFTCAST
ncbi:MAG: hypothetical protein AB1483_12345 [Candidatus Zixiibacteriota bacterium]